MGEFSSTKIGLITSCVFRHYSKPKNDRVGNLQGKGATIIELLEAGFPIFLWVATYSYGNGSKPVIAIIC